MKSPKGAVFQLLSATLIWGFGFVCTRYALASLHPLSFTGWRLLATFVLGSLIVLWPKPKDWEDWKSLLLLSLIPGVLLALNLGLQTIGMRYTTITNSGFITTLYALFTPLVDWGTGGSRPTLKHALCLTVAMVGTALLCSLYRFQGFNIGDGLTLLCAIAAAGHIVWVGRHAHKITNAFLFNLMQSLPAGLLCLLPAPLLGESLLPHSPMTQLVWWSLGYLVVISSLIGFTLQITAQRHVDPALASMVFLLESPFAAFFAYLIFKERLEPLQLLGAVLILVSTVLAVLPTRRTRRAANLSSESSTA